MANLLQIARYPVKALSPEYLTTVSVKMGRTLPWDRRFALTHGSHGLATGVGTATATAWRPPEHFVTLKRHPKLAAIHTTFETETGLLTIKRAGKPVAKGNILTAAGRDIIDQFFGAFLKGEVTGLPRIIDAAGDHFCDRQQAYVSILNAASLDDITRLPGIPDGHETLNPLRFRGNLLVDGWEPWKERSMIGKVLSIGTARLRVVQPIGRCLATHVDPATATRDLNILKALQSGLGHKTCGVYAVVECDGDITTGDAVTLS